VDEKLVAALPILLEIAKKKEFPDSVFAVESIASVFWEIAVVDGFSEPESSAVVVEHCEKLGLTYDQILDLSTETLRNELNQKITEGMNRVQYLVYALCMIAANKLNNTDSEVIYVEWSFWDDYDPNDMVRIPYDRCFFLQEIPYPILNSLMSQYRLMGFDLDKLLSEIEFRMKQIFDRDRDKFVIQKLTTTPN